MAAPRSSGYRAWAERYGCRAERSAAASDGAPKQRPVAAHRSRNPLRARSCSAAAARPNGRPKPGSLLCHWRVDRAANGPRSDQRDFRAFLAGAPLSRGARARGWIDAAPGRRRAARPRKSKLPAELVLAELDDPTPVQAALVSAVAAAGCSVEHWEQRRARAAARRAWTRGCRRRAASRVAWATARLEAEPATRIALVVVRPRGTPCRGRSRAGRGRDPPWHPAADVARRPAVAARPLIAAALERHRAAARARNVRDVQPLVAQPVVRRGRADARRPAPARDRLRGSTCAHKLPFARSLSRRRSGRLPCDETPDDTAARAGVRRDRGVAARNTEPLGAAVAARAERARLDAAGRAP